jgi:uncharacterized membrane protein YkvA (DUF1232 family)
MADQRRKQPPRATSRSKSGTAAKGKPGAVAKGKTGTAARAKTGTAARAKTGTAARGKSGTVSKDTRKAKSKHSEQAKTRAEKVLNDPSATKKLLDAAEKKSSGAKSRRFSEVRGQLKALLRLIRAYANGDYRAISWESLLLIVAAIIYFVSPIDAIPDFLPIGLVDDAAVIAFVVGMVAEELDDFMEWEERQSS